MPKTLVSKVYIKRKIFIQDPKQDNAFSAIKIVILNNVVIDINPNLQFYLVININTSTIERVLFQIEEVKVETEATPKFRKNEQINIFLFF